MIIKNLTSKKYSIFAFTAILLVISDYDHKNYWQAYAASGSIVLDNVQSTSATAALSPFSVTLSSFTVGGGTNKVLIVGVESSTGTVSGITYGGVALTQIVSKLNTVNTEFWILKNPTSGSADVVVTMSGSSTVIVGAYSFFGVDQTNSIPTTVTNSDIANNPSITIINNNAFSWVLDSVVVASTSLTNPTQTSRWNIQVIGVGDGASSSATTIQPNSSTTFGWTLGVVGSWAQIAIEVKAAQITETLSDSLGMTDRVTTARSIALSDSLGMTDSISTSNSASTSTPSPIARTGGGGGNTEPPSINGYAFSETEYSFSLDGKGYKLPSYVNSIPTTIFETGKPIEINLLLFSNSGQASIQHVSLYTNLHGLDSNNFQSDTFVTYEKNKPIQVGDPHNFFSNVSVNTIPAGNKLLVKFNVTFAKPMDVSPINLRIWDIYRNSVDTKILDAWQIIQPTSMINQEPTIPPIIQQNSTSRQNEISDIMSSIKEWGGYSSISISDSQLLEDLGMHGTHIPSWFMKTTKWVVSNEINPQDFLNALKYLYDNEIVR